MTSQTSSAAVGILLLQPANEFPGLGLASCHAAPPGHDVAVVAEAHPPTHGVDVVRVNHGTVRVL